MTQQDRELLRERVAHMEELYDRSREAVAGLLDALALYQSIVPQLRKLEAYYTSPQWLEDRDADAAEPLDGKRGILSEDTIWDLLTYEYRIKKEMHSIFEEETP